MYDLDKFVESNRLFSSGEIKDIYDSARKFYIEQWELSQNAEDREMFHVKLTVLKEVIQRIVRKANG